MQLFDKLKRNIKMIIRLKDKFIKPPRTNKFSDEEKENMFKDEIAYTTSVFVKDYYNGDREGTPNYFQTEKTIAERGYFKTYDCYIRDLPKGKWAGTKTINSKDLPWHWYDNMGVIPNYTKDKVMKMYMDEMFAIREMWIDPEYWQKLKSMDDEEARQDIINKFIEVYEVGARSQWSGILDDLKKMQQERERKEPGIPDLGSFFLAFAQLVDTHFKKMDFVRDLDKLIDEEGNALELPQSIENDLMDDIRALERKHGMGEIEVDKDKSKANDIK